MKSELTHRERVRLALEHRATDRVPLTFACAEPAGAAEHDLREYLQKERGISYEDYFGPLIDMVDFRPTYVGPPLEHDTDIWGVKRRLISHGRSTEYVHAYHPLDEAQTVDDLLSHRWPNPKWFDYSDIPGRIAAINADEEYCIYCLIGNLWEKSYYMRGFEQALVDLALHPVMLRTIMQKVTDFCIEHTRRILEAADGKIDVVFTADDMGTQEDLIMSVESWEQHIKPFHQQQNEMIHGFGAKVMYHTDGAVMKLVPGLIDMGIDALQALQFDANGMDPVVLKEQYGDRLCFVGGVSVQKTLPFGSVEDVQREVTGLIDILGSGGGYILGPSHEIPADTPAENIAAMFDTAASHKV
ncbi:uroporphyrinogen decarboxylase family protein [Gemmatimonadota bacterium]